MQQQLEGTMQHNDSIKADDRRSDGRYRPMANVSIDEITYRNIRTAGGKVFSAGHFQCDVEKHGHEDGLKGPPCTGLTMENIHIESAFGCEYEGVVKGVAIGSVEPPSCIPPH